MGKYLSAYNAVITKHFPRTRRFYIDLFAGPGADQIRGTARQIDGSPIRALSLRRTFTDYVLVEEDPQYFEALKARISASPQYQKLNVTVLHGDCNSLVHHIVKLIPQTAPTVLFADPEGLELKWDTVRQFASHRHLDLIMTFPYDMGIKRCAYDPKSYRAVDLFYGTQAWREIAEQRKASVLTARQARNAFAQLYVAQLTRINLSYAEPTLLRTRIVSGRPLYHMIFASRYYVALEIWRSISSRQVGTLDRFIR